MITDAFSASYGMAIRDPRVRTRRHVRWIIALVMAGFLIPWLFVQAIPSNQHLRRMDTTDALQSVGQTLPQSDHTAEQRVIYWWSDILSATKKTHVPPVLIATIMLHESKGKPNLYANGNPNGAYGLMQLEPGTAQGLPGYAPGARHNPRQNLLLGAELLKEDAADFGGNWLLAVAAYYGGPGAVTSHGVTGNMPWPQAAPLLNVVPCPAGRAYAACYHANDGLTMATYVNTIVANMRTVAHWQKQLALPAHLPTLFPTIVPLPAGVSADSLLGEVIEIVEAAGDVAAA